MSLKVILVAVLIAAAQAGILLGEGNGLGGIGGGLAVGGYNTGYRNYGYAQPAPVDFYTPPKYEYKYAVGDGHTGDAKEQVETRVGDLTKSEYVTGEKDRIIKVARVIAASAPVVRKGYY